MLIPDIYTPCDIAELIEEERKKNNDVPDLSEQSSSSSSVFGTSSSKESKNDPFPTKSLMRQPSSERIIILPPIAEEQIVKDINQEMSKAADSSFVLDEQRVLNVVGESSTEDTSFIATQIGSNYIVSNRHVHECTSPKTPQVASDFFQVSSDDFPPLDVNPRSKSSTVVRKSNATAVKEISAEETSSVQTNCAPDINDNETFPSVTQKLAINEVSPVSTKSTNDTSSPLGENSDVSEMGFSSNAATTPNREANLEHVPPKVKQQEKTYALVASTCSAQSSENGQFQTPKFNRNSEKTYKVVCLETPIMINGRLCSIEVKTIETGNENNANSANTSMVSSLPSQANELNRFGEQMEVKKNLDSKPKIRYSLHAPITEARERNFNGPANRLNNHSQSNNRNTKKSSSSSYQGYNPLQQTKNYGQNQRRGQNGRKQLDRKMEPSHRQHASRAPSMPERHYYLINNQAADSNLAGFNNSPYATANNVPVRNAAPVPASGLEQVLTSDSNTASHETPEHGKQLKLIFESMIRNNSKHDAEQTDSSVTQSDESFLRAEIEKVLNKMSISDGVGLAQTTMLNSTTGYNYSQISHATEETVAQVDFPSDTESSIVAAESSQESPTSSTPASESPVKKLNACNASSVDEQLHESTRRGSDPWNLRSISTSIPTSEFMDSEELSPVPVRKHAPGEKKTKYRKKVDKKELQEFTNFQIN